MLRLICVFLMIVSMADAVIPWDEKCLVHDRLDEDFSSMVSCKDELAYQLNEGLEKGSSWFKLSSRNLTAYYNKLYTSENYWDIVTSLNEYRTSQGLPVLDNCLCSKCPRYRGLTLIWNTDGIFNSIFMACDRKAVLLIEGSRPLIFL